MVCKVYKPICKLFLEGEDDEYIFAHLVLTVEWNFMSILENIVTCQAENIYRVEDALGFHFPKTKADQLGKCSDTVWHVYATPASPQTCTHISLTRCLFSSPGILTIIDSSNASGDNRDSDAIENVEGLRMATNTRINGGNKLFPGTNQ